LVLAVILDQYSRESAMRGAKKTKKTAAKKSEGANG